MSNIIEIQKGEGKWLKFTVSRDRFPFDLSTATLFFGMKELPGDLVYVYEVQDADWDKTQAASGTVRANLPASVTKTLDIKTYVAQAKFIITVDTDVDKTQELSIKIVAPIISD